MRNGGKKRHDDADHAEARRCQTGTPGRRSLRRASALAQVRDAVGRHQGHDEVEDDHVATPSAKLSVEGRKPHEDSRTGAGPERDDEQHAGRYHERNAA